MRSCHVEDRRKVNECLSCCCGKAPKATYGRKALLWLLVPEGEFTVVAAAVGSGRRENSERHGSGPPEQETERSHLQLQTQSREEERESRKWDKVMNFQSSPPGDTLPLGRLRFQKVP